MRVERVKRVIEGGRGGKRNSEPSDMSRECEREIETDRQTGTDRDKDPPQSNSASMRRGLERREAAADTRLIPNTLNP